jgi:hypothetical protein
VSLLRPADAVPIADGSIIHERLAVAMRQAPAVFRENEVGMHAQIIAVAAPTMDLDGQVALAKLGAWIRAFDDFVDDRDNDHATVALYVELYQQLITRFDCPALAQDPLARFLVEVLDELSLRHGARALWPVFATQMLASLDAMLWERSVHRVSLAAYLSKASESVFVKPMVTAAAILFEDEGLPLQALLAAERHAAVAIRIANDRATRAREQDEGAANVFVCAPGELHALDTRMADELNALVPELMELQACSTAEFLAVFTTKLLELYGAGQLT